MYGAQTYGQQAYAAVLDANDNSEPSKLKDLLGDPDSERIHLLEATPWDPIAGAETTVKAADKIFTIESASGRLDLFDYLPRLKQPFNYQANIFQREGGGSPPSLGRIQIANTDGELDSWLDYFWDGREITIKTGNIDFTLSEFEPVFKARAESLIWDRDKIEIVLRDARLRIDQPIQTNVYSGDGGIDGDSNVEGQVKPLSYGHPRNVPMVLIDESKLVYQVHDGSIKEVEEVRDAGVALNDEGNVSDIFSTSVSSGSYKTELGRGLIKLGASPNGQPTADIQGDNSGSGFVDTVADIAKRIIVNQTDLSATDMDGGSLSEMNIRFPHPSQIFIDGDQSIPSVLDRLFAPINGWWTFNRKGHLKIGLLRSPTDTAKVTLTEEDVGRSRLQRFSPGRVVWQARVGYRRMQQVQNKGSLADSVSASEKDLYSKEYRFVSQAKSDATDDGLPSHLLSEPIERRTVLRDQADAKNLADSLITVFGKRRDLYEISASWMLFRFDLDDVVELDVQEDGASRFNLPKKFRVVGFSENVGRGEASLTLWG